MCFKQLGFAHLLPMSTILEFYNNISLFVSFNDGNRELYEVSRHRCLLSASVLACFDVSNMQVS
jgi:hypothetical protein